MKIAVLGAGPLALHTTFHAITLGASVTLFAPHGPSERCRRLSEKWPELELGTWQELSTEQVRQALALNVAATDVVNAAQYAQYLQSLWTLVTSEAVNVKFNKVKRVHKRFLDPDETPLETTRFFDLFRVVYGLNPEAQMKQMGSEHPELTENLKNSLSEKDWQALHSEAESFEDFDAVFEATGRYQSPRPAGPSASFALNEAYTRSQGGIHYGIKGLEAIDELLNSEAQPELGDYVIVGSGELAAMALTRLGQSDWNRVQSITLITTEVEPFLKLRQQGHALTARLEEILLNEARSFETLIANYEKELHAWRELEVHVRSKTPAPTAPKRRLRLWGGANITAVDRLTDRQELFVTTELPAFRSEVKKEGEKMMTIACQQIFVFTGHFERSLFAGASEGEVGHYRLRKMTDVEASFERLLENFSRAQA